MKKIGPTTFKGQTEMPAGVLTAPAVPIACAYWNCKASTRINITFNTERETTIDLPLPEGWSITGQRQTFRCPNHKEEGRTMPREEVKTKVLGTMKELAGHETEAGAAAQANGFDVLTIATRIGRAQNTTRVALYDLAREGKVQRVGRGSYALPKSE